MKMENIYWASIAGVVFFGVMGISNLDKEKIVAVPCLIIFGICVLVMYLIEKRHPEINRKKEAEEKNK